MDEATTERNMCSASNILKSHIKLMSSVASGKARPFKDLPGPRRFQLLGTINDVIHLGNPKTYVYFTFLSMLMISYSRTLDNVMGNSR